MNNITLSRKAELKELIAALTTLIEAYKKHRVPMVLGLEIDLEFYKKQLSNLLKGEK